MVDEKRLVSEEELVRANTVDDQEKAVKKNWFDRHPGLYSLLFLAIWIGLACLLHFQFHFCQDIMSAIFLLLVIVIGMAFAGLVFWLFVWGTDKEKILFKSKGRVLRLIIFFLCWFVFGYVAFLIWKNILWAIIGPPIAVACLMFVVSLCAAASKESEDSGINFPLT